MSSRIRLQKFMSDCGVVSRRKAEEWILSGRVSIQGKVVRTLGVKVDPSQDMVQVDGEILTREGIEKIYLVLHKPRAYLTTLSDPEGRPTVMDLCREISERIYPVGRLSYLSEGLLILTNDGELAQQMMRVRYQVLKVYEVKILGHVYEGLLKKLRKSIALKGGIIKPKSVRVIGQLPGKTWLEIRLIEEKNCEIQKFCEGHDLRVDKLRRVAVGGLSIVGLASGKFRALTKKQLLRELDQDFRSVKKTIKKGAHTVNDRKTQW